MLDHTLLESIAGQLLEGDHVSVEGNSVPVRRTSFQRLRSVKFVMKGKEYQAIEQNAEKPSRWGQLARDGHRVVQIREAYGKYVAVVVDGKVKEYERS